MRVTAPVTDYVRASVLTTQGDMLLRGLAIPKRFAPGLSGQVLRAKATDDRIAWQSLFNLITTTGDLLIRGVGVDQTFPAGAAGTYLQGKGAGVLPAYEATMPPLTTQGDLILQGAANPQRLASGWAGSVLTGNGAGALPYWKSLFDTLTTQGDLWVRGPTIPQRIAAGLLDTYFKGQGAGALPIYEKLALRDTGVKIGNSTRDAAGDQVITGVGFRPSIIFFMATDATLANRNDSWGVDDGTTSWVLYIFNDGTESYTATNKSINIARDAGNKISGAVSALGADGFTITWAITGACVANFFYLCLP